MIKNDEIALVINTVEERRNAIADSRAIRTSALLARVTTYTTIAGARAAVEGMKHHGRPATCTRCRSCTRELALSSWHHPATLRQTPPARQRPAVFICS